MSGKSLPDLNDGWNTMIYTNLKIYNYKMSVTTIILNILLPPVAVFIKHGMGTTLLISIVLTIVAWIPGVIHAFIVNE